MSIIAQTFDIGWYPGNPWVIAIVGLVFLIAPVIIWFIYLGARERKRDKRILETLDDLLEGTPVGTRGKTFARSEAKCRQCGGTVDVIDSICPFCGSDLDGSPSSLPEATYGVLRRDISFGHLPAFRERELVQIEKVDPDPETPENRYVVTSKTLGKQFRLSDHDLMT